VQSGTKPPLGLGTAPSHPGSTQLAETMPASQTFPIRMATVGYYRNVATGMFDAMWTSGCNQWDVSWTILVACKTSFRSSQICGNAPPFRGLRLSCFVSGRDFSRATQG
jgi:hypothetical protein